MVAGLGVPIFRVFTVAFIRRDGVSCRDHNMKS